MSFHFKQFSILHQTEGLKVNTDGCLLGALAKSESPKTCLDIGTGTGVIALMLAQKYPEAQVTAVELNALAFLQAQHNIEASPFNEKIQVINADILQFESTNQYDLIVCNPPYFKQHLKSANEHRNMALHNDHLPQDKLIKKVAQFLTIEGIFWAIYPPHQMETFILNVEQEGLFLNEIFRIENKAGQSYRTICSFSKKRSEPLESTIILTNEQGQRSETFSKLMFDFYL